LAAGAFVKQTIVTRFARVVSAIYVYIGSSGDVSGTPLENVPVAKITAWNREGGGDFEGIRNEIVTSLETRERTERRTFRHGMVR